MTTPPANWYADPAGAGKLRWFDGTSWTHHVCDPPSAAPQHYPGQQPATGCQVCGAAPAEPFQFHEHHGMVLMQRFVKYSGRWCRDCALSQFRRAQSRTLLYGWWGLISFFANIAAVVQNIGGYRKASALPTPAGRTRAPLPQRGSVFVSPGFGVVAAVLALLVATKLF